MDQILIVDDDVELCGLVQEYLTSEGFSSKAVHDGERGLQLGMSGDCALVVLDVMLPGINGFEVLRRLRGVSKIPVLLLTARGEDVDRIVGLEIGADDYLPKPFNPRELVARIKAVLRRAQSPTQAASVSSGALGFCGYVLDQAQRRLVDRDGQEVILTAGEYELLVALACRPRRVLSRDDLLEITRGRSAGPFDRSIDVQISRLRRKIEPDPADPSIIKTVRSGGYVFAPEVQTL